MYVGEPFLDPGTKLVHLDNASWEVEKIYPTEVGVLADPKAGLAELAMALDQDMSASAKEAAATRSATWGELKSKSAQDREQRARAKWDNRPMPVERMMHELAQAVPEGTILADESITSRGAVMGAFDFDEPGSMYGIRGGALGWGMPGALGVKMANPDRPVLAIVGDGASLYTVQALVDRLALQHSRGLCHLQQPRLPDTEGQHGDLPAQHAEGHRPEERLRRHGL